MKAFGFGISVVVAVIAIILISRNHSVRNEHKIVEARAYCESLAVSIVRKYKDLEYPVSLGPEWFSNAPALININRVYSKREMSFQLFFVAPSRSWYSPPDLHLYTFPSLSHPDDDMYWRVVDIDR